MKKLNIIAFIIMTILIFSSCNQANEPSQPIKPSGGEIPMVGLYSEDEYNAYMADATLPEHFISYEQLSHLGSFRSLVFLEHANLENPKNLKFNYNFEASFLPTAYLNGEFSITRS